MKFLLLINFVFLFSVVQTAYANLDVDVKVKASLLPNGRTLYEYIIINKAKVVNKIRQFEIDIGEDSAIASVRKNKGWYANLSPEYASPYNPCGPSLAWIATVDAKPLQPESQLSFSFTSKLKPSRQGFSVVSSDLAETDQESKSGDLLGPGKKVACGAR